MDMMERAREFLLADKTAKQHKRLWQEYNQEKESHAAALLDDMINAGISTFKIDGVTIYLHSQLWANAKVHETSGTRNFGEACQALVECGYAELVETKFNTQRVSSLIRELDGSDEGIPERLKETLDITEKISPRARGNK